MKLTMKKITVVALFLLMNSFVVAYAQYESERMAAARAIAGITLACEAAGSDHHSRVNCMDAGMESLRDTGGNVPQALLEACVATRTISQEVECYDTIVRILPPGPIKNIMLDKQAECSIYNLRNQSVCWRQVLREGARNWKPL
ncbi:MAG: hypothetical protein ACFCBW_16145 [Candidatus Competibacterales bacterium]